MRINELKAGMNNINILGEVTELTEPKQIMTKFGTQTTLTTCKLKDETGTIHLTMWGTQSDGVNDGQTIEIKNGYVKDFRGELQLGVGKTGSIEVTG